MSNIEEKRLSKEVMAFALMDLCDSNSFSTITISDVCKKAGMSRMAFYRNFKTKEDIFTSYFEMILEDFLFALKNQEKKESYSSMGNLTFTFEYFKRHSRFICCLRKVYLGDILLNNVISYELKKYYKEYNPQLYYSLIAYAGSIYSVYMAWLESDFKATSATLAKYIYSIYKQK